MVAKGEVGCVTSERSLRTDSKRMRRRRRRREGEEEKGRAGEENKGGGRGEGRGRRRRRTEGKEVGWRGVGRMET